MNGREEEFLPSPETTATLLAVSSLPADRARLRRFSPTETGNCTRRPMGMRICCGQTRLTVMMGEVES